MVLSEYERLLPASHLSEVDAQGFIPKPGEEVYVRMPAGLYEWKKQSGYYEGGLGLRAVSFRIPGTGSARAYWGGLHRPEWIEGVEGWTPTDQGDALVTSHRVVFRGIKGYVEWSFDKLVGLDVDEAHQAMALQAANRQKTNILLLSDLLFFYVKLQASLARFRGESPTTPTPPEPPEELAGESFEPRMADFSELASGILEEQGEVELARSAQIAERRSQLHGELAQANDTSERSALKRRSRRDIERIQADRQGQLDELDQMFVVFQAIASRDWEPPPVLPRSVDEPGDPPTESDTGIGSLPRPELARNEWGPNDHREASYVWSNMHPGARKLFGILLESSGAVGWRDLASSLGPDAGEDTVFGTFGPPAKLAKEVGRRHMILSSHSAQGNSYWLEPTVKMLLEEARARG